VPAVEVTIYGQLNFRGVSHFQVLQRVYFHVSGFAIVCDDVKVPLNKFKSINHLLEAR
jgi:hypothetical protein